VDSVNERITRLRDQSVSEKPSLSIERAKLLTEFYQGGEADKVSIPVARALAFNYILENKEICINEGELIVGERGPKPVATPTYPEICCHSLKDLDILGFLGFLTKRADSISRSGPSSIFAL